MARIRTIKPEFPQSESVGRLSREARLLFVQLWTIADDFGKLRGASRLLASSLYPYDDDAKDLIDGWLAECERERVIIRYEVDGASYIQIANWSKHQKVDKPSPSKFPDPRELSRKSRERSPLDLGPRTKDQGPKDHTPSLRSGVGGDEPPPTIDEPKEAISVWNDMAAGSGLSQVRELTNERRAKIRCRLRECGGLGAFRSIVGTIPDIPWMLGDNDRGWKADFDFILQPKSFAKLREGSYANRAQPAARSDPWANLFPAETESPRYDLEMTRNEHGSYSVPV